MKLGILGGMGPMATADFFKKVIELTDASSDQEHIHVLIDSNSEIPDRTNFILNKGEDPKAEMVRTATKLELMGADVIAMPCNTAHYFYDAINHYTHVPIVNMIEETAKFIMKHMPDQKTFVLLATQGTYVSSVYETIFNQYGLTIIQPDASRQTTVMEWIYEVKAGDIKVSTESFEKTVVEISKGVELPVILGCTELPVLVEALHAKGQYIDPTHVLAKACIEFLRC